MAAGAAVEPIAVVSASLARKAGEREQREREPRDRCEQPTREDRRQGARAAAGLYARKLHSFWPTNDSGVAAAIEIACATTFAKPAPSTSDTSTA